MARTGIEAQDIDRSHCEFTTMNPAIRSGTRVALVATTVVLLVSGCNRIDDRNSESSAPAPTSKSISHDQHAAPASHDAHADHSPAPILAEGQRWPTDEALRAAMTRIREAVERIDPQQLQTANANVLATAVEQDVAYMVSNCRLEPEPDAALHLLIGRMMNAAAALRKDPMSDAGMPQLMAVLHEYQATFDHPGWTAVGQGH